MKKKKIFIKNKNIKLEVNEDKYLYPMLTPTSKNSNYYDPAPKGDVLTNRYFGRVLLQLHQILGLFYSLGIKTKNKKILDIGTGNALIPQLFLNYSDISSAVGIDPYEENEHMTSWQPNKTNNNVKKIIQFINKNTSKTLSFQKYKKFLNQENFSFIPPEIKIKKNNKKKELRKIKIGAHDLSALNEKFDIIYCKAIEHIPNWESVFKNINKVSKKGTVVYFKHRSFFSYLGAHRFASIGIPWGHVILNDKDYKKFTKKFHPQREDKMNNFFFKGLAYPRYSVSDMCKIASKYNFYPLYISSEKPRYFNKILKFTNSIKDFWKIVKNNYPSVSSEEVLSGMYHIVFKKL
tara:strand:- start:237 stop:1283 length:1047 start_codon:yes stop_codon:yes gene_type:complete